MMKDREILEDAEMSLSGFEQLVLVRVRMSDLVNEFRKKIDSAADTTPNLETTPSSTDLTLESLEPIFALCEECRRSGESFGNQSYYVINGKLLANVRVGCGRQVAMFLLLDFSFSVLSCYLEGTDSTVRSNVGKI